jgi:hypothetical protein
MNHGERRGHRVQKTTGAGDGAATSCSVGFASPITQVMVDLAVSGSGRGHGRPARLVCRKTGGTPVPPELPPQLLANHTRRARVQRLPGNSIDPRPPRDTGRNSACKILGTKPQRCYPRADFRLNPVMKTKVRHEKLRNPRMPPRAEPGALSESLAAHGPTSHGKPGTATAGHLPETAAGILQLRKGMARAGE